MAKAKILTWKTKDPTYQVTRDNFTYYDIPSKVREINPDVYLPRPYDLVVLVLQDGRKINGWWTGNGWFARRLKDRKVVYWIRPYYRD